MHIAGNSHSIDLTPGASALYDGMTSDGTMVYFTTADVPTGASDGDTSADIYRAGVSSSSATLTRVSTGTSGTGDIDFCDPAGNSFNFHGWNTIPGGPADCSVVAVGGGGGVASGGGSIYFLSPEQLDGGGVDGAPNLYLARPDSDPHFVTTLESGASSPLPPAVHNFKRSFGSFTNPAGVAIDHASGDVYVLDTLTGFPSGGFVTKFDSSGNVVTGFANNGVLDGSSAPTGPFAEAGSFGLPTEIAVDNDPSSPSYGDLYVPDLLNGVVDKFDSSGTYISQIPIGSGFPAAVAVDRTNGHVYVPSYFGDVSVFDANGNPVAPTSFPGPAFVPISIAVDSSGNSYITDTSKTEVYDSAGNDVKTLDANPSYGVAIDPSDDHIYVDEGNQVVEFDSSGAQVGTSFGSGHLSNSVGLGADSGRLVISNPGSSNVVEFDPPATPPGRAYDNPLVIDSVGESATPHTADFQTTPSGDYAVFPSVLSLDGSDFDSAGKYEVFRFDATAGQLDCTSCNPTDQSPATDASLASDGQSISDDGRVFFNTGEPLVLRDVNKKGDAYEWNERPELISSGTDSSDSGLLSISSDGTDAFFFTRETLAPNDTNGHLMKLYDARANGGFFTVPPPPPCVASDECHGPGSQPVPRAPVGTNAGSGGNLLACPKRKIKRHGRCVQRKHRHHSKRAAKARHGGAR
jgi:hypothetical protein